MVITKRPVHFYRVLRLPEMPEAGAVYFVLTGDGGYGAPYVVGLDGVARPAVDPSVVVDIASPVIANAIALALKGVPGLPAFEALVEEIAIIQSALSDLDARMDGAELSIATIMADVQSIDARVEAVEVEISAADVTLTQHEQRIDVLEMSGAGVDASLASLDGRVDAVEDIRAADRLALLESGLAAADSVIDAHGDRLDSIEKELVDDGSRLVIHETRIAALESATGDAYDDTVVLSRLDGIESELVADGAQLVDHENRLDAIEGSPPVAYDDTAIRNRLDEVEGELVTDGAQLSDHENRLDAIEGAPASAYDDAAVKAQLSDHENRLDVIEEAPQVTYDDTEIKSRLDDVESGLVDDGVRLSDHENRLDAIEATPSVAYDDTAVKAQLSDHENRLDAIEGSAPIAYDDTSIKARLDDVEAELVDDGSQLSDHENRLTALEAAPGGGSGYDDTAVVARLDGIDGILNDFVDGDDVYPGLVSTVGELALGLRSCMAYNGGSLAIPAGAWKEVPIVAVDCQDAAARPDIVSASAGRMTFNATGRYMIQVVTTVGSASSQWTMRLRRYDENGVRINGIEKFDPVGAGTVAEDGAAPSDFACGCLHGIIDGQEGTSLAVAVRDAANNTVFNMQVRVFLLVA